LASALPRDRGLPAAGTALSAGLPAAWRRALLAPIDVAPIVVFRIAFGVCLGCEVVRYFAHGWIRRYWIEPAFHFTYYGFGWVRPWPGAGMYVHVGALGVLAMCIAVGYRYRLASALFFVGFAYVFLLDEARYLNHFYLITLLAFLLVFVPGERAASIDARRDPSIARGTAPAWTLWLLRAQVAIAYVYAGIAKINPDWLAGEPMRARLARRTAYPVVGRWFTDERVVWGFTYGGLVVDLAVVPLLLWRRTRPLGFALAVSFHLMNATLFDIGIFPWLMLGATLLFLPPPALRPVLARAGIDLPAPTPAVEPPPPRVVTATLAVYLLLQLVVPLRHFVYPGNVDWTEEGHRFSWHMMLRDKDADVRFVVSDAERTWEVEPEDYVAGFQAEEMPSRPDMILQLAHHIADDLRAKGHRDVHVRARAWASLNGRPRQLLIDPSVDLAAEPRTLRHARWIRPLTVPLPGAGG